MTDSPFRAGFVAILGRPNAGKSTLVNAMTGFPLAIVSRLPQTTRHKILGIINGEGYQLCLIDTPGYLDKSMDGLQKKLIQSARSAAGQDADIIVLLVEPKAPPPEDLKSLQNLADRGKPIVLVVNKRDISSEEDFKAAQQAYNKVLPIAQTRYISAKMGKGVKGLIEVLTALLPESEPYYPTDQVSDRWERFFAGEAIRLVLFELMHKELPHACAVVIERFKERDHGKDQILALICVERQTQKGIVIGKGGKMLREIRKRALAQLEETLGRKVELELFVKVKRNWRKDPNALKDLGYTV